jgi:hypothetical protein
MGGPWGVGAGGPEVQSLEKALWAIIPHTPEDHWIDVLGRQGGLDLPNGQWNQREDEDTFALEAQVGALQ